MVEQCKKCKCSICKYELCCNGSTICEYPNINNNKKCNKKNILLCKKSETDLLLEKLIEMASGKGTPLEKRKIKINLNIKNVKWKKCQLCKRKFASVQKLTLKNKTLDVCSKCYYEHTSKTVKERNKKIIKIFYKELSPIHSVYAKEIKKLCHHIKYRHNINTIHLINELNNLKTYKEKSYFLNNFDKYLDREEFIKEYPDIENLKIKSEQIFHDILSCKLFKRRYLLTMICHGCPYYPICFQQINHTKKYKIKSLREFKNVRKRK